jgi:beta-glucosidase
MRLLLFSRAISSPAAQHNAANAKHYAFNNQETNRGSVIEVVDERTRFEIYYPPFAGAAQADVGASNACPD